MKFYSNYYRKEENDMNIWEEFLEYMKEGIKLILLCFILFIIISLLYIYFDVPMNTYYS